MRHAAVEGITQKLKWNVAIRDTNTAEVEEFTRRQALARVKRERGGQRAPPHYSMSDPEGAQEVQGGCAQHYPPQLVRE